MLPFGRQDLTLFLFARKGAFHSVKQFSFCLFTVQAGGSLEVLRKMKEGEALLPRREEAPLVFQLRPESVRILAPAADADFCSFGKVALG